MHSSIAVKMFLACCACCVMGIILMAVTAHYLLMATFAAILLCVTVTTWLFTKHKISVEAACLAPMLILCFVYTPLSWFTYNGLMGCTPYLSILFATMITLTYYRKIQALLLTLYGALMLALTAHWLATQLKNYDAAQIFNILIAYGLTSLLILIVLESVKRKNLEINQNVTDLSLHDDLTGLYNRRASEQALGNREQAFVTDGVDYGIVMMDVDKFKSINDLYGHNLGDAVLKSIAGNLRNAIRATDYAFRYGGDEFMLILTNVDTENTSQVCRRIETSLCKAQDFSFTLTVSMGCALRSQCANSMSVVELADQRMYDVKKTKCEKRA